MILEQTPRAQPLVSAVRQMSSVSPEIQLATLVRAAREAIQSDPGTRYNDEAVGRSIDEGGASGSAPAEEDSLRVSHRGKLQRVVGEYTRQMRNLGHYPEKVLVAVKLAVRDVATPVIRYSTLDALVRDAAQWSIAAYFDMNLEKGNRPILTARDAVIPI